MRHLPLLTCLAALTAAPAVAQDGLQVGGLQAPRGLSVSDDTLLVAEQATGRVLAISPQGVSETLVEGLVAAPYDSPEGPAFAGPAAAVRIGETVYVLIGGSARTVEGSAAVYSVTEDGAPELFADIGAYELENNPGGDTLPDGEPDPDTNPYDLISDGGEGLFVSDAGGNTIYHLDAEGEMMLYAVFHDLENPLFGTAGGPTIDQVPTGLAIGPDGALYVSTLTGFPFPPGAARVYKLADANGDGDAADEGEMEVFADGLTAATDIAFDPDEALLVAEFSTDMTNQAPGRLVRVAGGEITEVAAPLVSPTGIAVLPDGRIVASQEFLGTVSQVPAETP